MLTKIEIVNPAGSTLALDMFDSSNGYVIEEITGLEPSKASFSSSTLPNFDGEQFMNSRTDKRNIVATLRLEPDDPGSTSVQELRRGLYPFFMPGTEVLLRFFMDNEFFCEIRGRIESLDAPLFTREPKAVISILCFDPYFRSNDSVTPEQINVDWDYDYYGDVETGIFAEFTLLSDDHSGFRLRVVNSKYGTQVLEVLYDFQNGDLLRFNSTPGNKELTLVRDDEEVSLLGYIAPRSVWPLVTPGANSVSIFDSGWPSSPPSVPWVDYVVTVKYGGL